MKFYLRPPNPSFPMGLGISSPVPTSCRLWHRLPNGRPEHALWREFELARPHILGALLDAAAHGLHMLPGVRLERLPRMADFALWATACESAFRPAGVFEPRI